MIGTLNLKKASASKGKSIRRTVDKSKKEKAVKIMEAELSCPQPKTGIASSESTGHYRKIVQRSN